MTLRDRLFWEEQARIMTQKEAMTKLRFGFRSKRQLPLFMVWREYFDDNGEVEFASVEFIIRGYALAKSGGVK